MKILFICGSLEKSKDGVGDYTRRLACELISQGHSCVILALMDKFVSNAIKETQLIDNQSILTLRLPFNSGYSVNCRLAKNFVESFNSDWISLQYVPFAFENKGLPIFLSGHLRRLVADKFIHTMFHELWVGMNVEATMKLKFWGLLQRYIIKSFLLKIRPKQSHTHNNLYLSKIKKWHLSVDILPLFSNIPKLNNISVPDNLNRTMNFVVFGTIHFGAPIKFFASELGIFLNSKKLKGAIRFIGKNGVELSQWKAAFEENDITVIELNEQPEEIISKTLYTSDFGISSTPYILHQKSGTVAAMLEHGLPIITVARNWNVNGYDEVESDYVVNYKENHLERVLENFGTKVINHQFKNTIQVSANKMIQDLSKWRH